MIELIPPITGSLGLSSARGDRALSHGPNFLRGRESEYWHRPRSGIAMRGDRIVWHYWCGVSAHADTVIERSDPPQGEPVCGTCEGRAIGAGMVAGNSDHDLKFTPRYQAPPKVCPGSGTDHAGLWTRVAPRVGRCLVCGTWEPIRWRSSYDGGEEKLASHQPVRDLGPLRCDFHGWQQLVARDGVVVCACTPKEGDA